MDGPDHPIVFFDGHCGLCNRSVDYLLRKDARHVLRFAPLQGETARALFEGVPEQDLMRSLWLRDEGGLHKKSTAWLRAVRRLGGLMRLLGVLWIVPRGLRDGAYDLVARNRYKVWGRTEACRVPSSEERAYFLP